MGLSYAKPVSDFYFHTDVQCEIDETVEEGENAHYNTVTFSFGGHGVDTTIVLSDPCSVKKDVWKTFRACSHGEMVFCKSNGNVRVTRGSSGVVFVVSKHGLGGDGEATVTLDETHMERFDDFLDTVIEDEDMNKEWGTTPKVIGTETIELSNGETVQVDVLDEKDFPTDY